MHGVVPQWNNMPARCFSLENFNGFRVEIRKIDFNQFLGDKA